MTFSEMDAVEQHFNKRVQVMTAQELISYWKTYVRALHEINLPVSRTMYKERAVFQSLMDTYGKDAGLILKWVGWKYNCEWKQRDQSMRVIGYFSFSQRWKPWLDDMYIEMQQQMKKELQDLKVYTDDRIKEILHPERAIKSAAEALKGLYE